MAEEAVKFAIYTLSDGDRIRYVGKAKNPDKRLRQHLWPAKSKRDHLANWIRKLRAEGRKPVMNVIEWTGDWEQCEQRWITYFRSQGADLLNVAAGGLDMAHVAESRGRFPAYAWALRFCGRKNRPELASIIKAKADEARSRGEMVSFEAELMVAINEAMPLARVA
jgi:hypothetical protein